MYTIAEKIKELRIEANLTQPELAKLVGVSNGTISFWENGQSTPRFFYIRRLAESLNTTPEYLLEDESNNQQKIETTEKLSKNEEKLLQAYRKMSEGKKRALFQMLDIDQTETKTRNSDNS